ncbi:MAG TPA: hypothetical protein VHT70_05750 [Candidatus Saccharimonadales bacterium]|jgi:hypothetical protein|nr:hypothetical protein [Candidatus Saccharimonadales bacterium]
MSILQFIGVASGVLAAVAYVPYVRDIFKGDAKPERVSWFIWVVLACIAFFSQLAEGAHSSLWFTGLDSVGAVVIFLLALRYGAGGFTRRDKIGLLTAGIGLLLWYVTRHAAIALLLTIIVDASGAWLTVAVQKSAHRNVRYVGNGRTCGRAGDDFRWGNEPCSARVSILYIPRQYCRGIR